MALILGLDPSIRKSGFCVLDTQKPDNHYVEMGRLRTGTEDGILVQRLIKQSEQIRSKMRQHGITFVSMEAPVKATGESEELYALNQFLHRVFLEEGAIVVSYPPSRLKKMAVPDGGAAGREIGKPQMILACRKQLGLDSNPADDAADAFWAGFFGKKFYQVQYEGAPESGLRDDLRQVFYGKKTFTRGVKAGVTVHDGIVFRVNEFFYDFKKLREAKGGVPNGR